MLREQKGRREMTNFAFFSDSLAMEYPPEVVYPCVALALHRMDIPLGLGSRPHRVVPLPTVV